MFLTVIDDLPDDQIKVTKFTKVIKSKLLISTPQQKCIQNVSSEIDYKRNSTSLTIKVMQQQINFVQVLRERSRLHNGRTELQSSTKRTIQNKIKIQFQILNQKEEQTIKTKFYYKLFNSVKSNCAQYKASFEVGIE
ncbi:Hypothetical_protein [Hexamita inflata]|uniref:Hypothetical_protein n=1 Tax=Hexamita inflata TaxID=28002 RepID=A0AA86NWE6_9EUKA|nr:Hypothetical protein HINF_LOCUS14734 [Hexamita inflata]